ncbi:MAG: CHAD domain-containing protein [Solirubrobacteraceae bacterium]
MSNGTSVDELVPPPELGARAATERLGQSLEAYSLKLSGGEPDAARRVYLETFDGRLRAAGLAVVHTRRSDADGPGTLAAIDRDTGAERASLEHGAPNGPLLALDLEPGPLRELLLPIVDVRALLPLVELDCEFADYAVLDDERKTVVRLSLEQASLISEQEPLKSLRPRIRVAGVRGYARERERVGVAARGLGFTVARHRLLDEAVIATGAAPGGTSSKVGVELLGAQRADAAAAAVLRRLSEVIEANFEGTIDDTDAEFLHDLRVAVRKTRAVLRELRDVFPPTQLAHFRGEFKWLQAVTGPSRDLDVYVLDFDELRSVITESMRADLDPMLRVLRDQRETARRAMVRELSSPRTQTLRRDWDAFLEELVATATDDRPEAERAIGELAGQRIRKVYRRMLKLGDTIDESSPAEDYHEIRKQGKELRYLLELFGQPLFPGETVKPLVKTLKGLQDVLGRHQDREVQVTRLRELAEPVSALPGRAGALMAMGVLIERLHEQELAARAEFAESYEAFSSEELRKQVKAVFD